MSTPDINITEGHLLKYLVEGRQDAGDIRIRLSPNGRRLEIARVER